jgi:MYXO-CTERM domain-containing protein
MQPAAALRGGDLFILSNHLLAQGRYETRMWRLHSGLGAAKATSILVEDAFNGYPALPEVLPAAVATLPYVYARATSPDGAGEERVLRVAADPPAAVLSLEQGRAVLPQGRAISVLVQTTPGSGLSGTVHFDLTGQPEGVHGSFDPPQVEAGATTTLTLAADAAVPPGSSSCSVAVSAATGRTEIPFNLEVVPPGEGGCSSATAPAPLIGLALMLLAARRRRSSPN